MTSPVRPSGLRRLRFLITPRWIILLLAVGIFVASAFWFLAPWQFARSAQRDAFNARLAAAIAHPPASIGELLSPERQPAEDTLWRLVATEGHFDVSRQAYVRLRQDNDGQPANEVIVPFVTDSGVVLVDRGYVPFAGVSQGAALPALPTGTVTITGRVQTDQTDPKNRPPVTAPDGLVQYMAPSSAILTADSSLDAPVYQGFLQLTSDSPGVIDAIALPQEDSGPFFGYALQWIGFGAVAIAGIAYFIYREFSDPVDGAIYVREDAREPDGDAEPDNDPADDEASKPRRKPRFDKSQLFDS